LSQQKNRRGRESGKQTTENLTGNQRILTICGYYKNPIDYIEVPQ